MFLGIVKLSENLTFYANTHTPATGAAVDADAVPGYRVYEDETGTPLLTGSMALLDDDDSVGFYAETITCSAANGFEAGKSYTVRITGVVGGVTGVELHQFTCAARATDDLAYPTVSGRSLDVTATGAAGVDWANVENPTTTVGLSGTTVKAVTDGVSLVNDAITSAKFDESTAFPLKAADTGSTYIARTGADSDTLETLSDQIDGVSGAAIADAVWDEATADHTTAGTFGAWVAAATSSLAAIIAAIAAAVTALPAAVWAYLTRTLTTVAATSTSATGTTLSPIIAGMTYSATISGLTIPVDWTQIRLTVKADQGQDDDESTMQILESNPADGADGLQYLNGAAGTAAQASLTIDQAAGTATILIKPAATAQLGRAAALGYDLVCSSGVDTVTRLDAGTVAVSLTETRTTA